MKRYGNLYDGVCSFEALLAASRKARRGKRFKASTARFEYDLEKRLFGLERELMEQTYHPGKYKEFHIYETKPRKISAAPYRDRVVQHALCAVIAPIFERTFISDSYACRKGKGTHKAVDRFTYYARRFKYVLKFDIAKYFPSIDHEVLKQKIRRKIKCARTLWLIDLIIDSSNPQEGKAFYFNGDGLFTPHERRKGIPIGNLASQLFALIYLNDVDHLAKERFASLGYTRYMDDMALFGDDKRELWGALREIEALLEKDRLKLKRGASMIYPVEIGVDYLGYKVYPNHRRLRYENVVRYTRRLRRLQRMYSAGHIGLADVSASVQSWIGHIKHADTWGLRENLFGSITFRRGGAPDESCVARRVVEQ